VYDSNYLGGNIIKIKRKSLRPASNKVIKIDRKAINFNVTSPRISLSSKKCASAINKPIILENKAKFDKENNNVKIASFRDNK